jgi:hypothetical protein
MEIAFNVICISTSVPSNFLFPAIPPVFEQTSELKETIG